MDHDYQQLGNAFREAFDGFEQKPDPTVWKGLSRQLFVRRLFKISYTWVLPALLVTAVAFWLVGQSPDTKQVTQAQTDRTTSYSPAMVDALPVPDRTSPEVSQSVVEHKEEVAAQPTVDKPQVHLKKAASVSVQSIPSTSKVVVKPIDSFTTTPSGTPPASEEKSQEVKEMVKEPVIAKKRVASSEPVVVVEKVVPAIENPKEVQVTETNYAICAGEEVSLTAPEGWRYNWTTGDFARNITVKPAETTVYEVSIDDRDGNQSVLRFVITILDCSIYVPKAFSPNDDGSNDQFLVRAEGIVQFEMKVYSKWGELVYESRNISQGWDGRIRGSRAPVDAYIYQIRYSDDTGNWHHMQGSVTLIP